MTNHSWDEELIKQHGNDRCSKCGIQYEYYNRGLSDMESWSEEDIKLEPKRYEEIIKSYKECHPRHD